MLNDILTKIRANLTLKSIGMLGVKTVRHRLACGRYITLNPNDVLGKRIYLERYFEPAVRDEFLRQASRDVNVLDIGANIGYFSLLASSVISEDKRVFAFEPQPKVVAKLRNNISINSLTNVTVFPHCLSDVDGFVPFQIPPEGVEAFGSIHSNGRFDVTSTVQVVSKRLDDVLADLGNPKIGLIKMDAEGAELPILRGARKLLQGHDKPVIIFEANEENCKPFGYSVFDLLIYVREQGYRLRQLDGEDWLAEPDPSMTAYRAPEVEVVPVTQLVD